MGDVVGVGPILGEGEAGASLQEDGTRGLWYYENGKAGWRLERSLLCADYQRSRTLTAMSPVAVLIDRDTGSSGEGLAIAFRGRPDTRFFGETTYGAATSTSPYKLSDGAQIFLVAGVMVDRKGNEYPDGVAPVLGVEIDALSDLAISNCIGVVLRVLLFVAGKGGE